jgi:hypothetical protein
MCNMSDLKVEAYKKSVTSAMERYGKAVADAAKQIDEISKQLEPLEKLDSPSADDKKKIAELTKKRDACRKAVEQAGMNLKTDLILIDPPTESDADKRELVKLPGWLKDIIKKKGIPLGKDVSVAPTVDFDFKAGKLKSFGIKITW